MFSITELSLGTVYLYMFYKILTATLLGMWCYVANAEEPADSSINLKAQKLQEVMVTGVRGSGIDPRLSPFTITQIPYQQIENRLSPSLLDVVSEQTPSLFVTQRGVLGYGVGSGGAGGLSIRGIGSSASVPQTMPVSGVMVLIDGHPQYMGIMGHPISDAYQSFLAEKVEVLRGPASMLYGSNAMGGIINIITHRIEHDGSETHVQLAGGSYGTFTSDISNRLQLGRFSSVASASYNRSDGHRSNMGFEQGSGYLKLGYELNSIWKVYVDGNLTHYDAQTPGTVNVPMEDDKQHITRGVVSLGLQNNYQWTSGGLSVFYNFGNHKINDGYESIGGTPRDYYYRSKDHVAGLNAYQQFHLWQGNRTTFGFDWQNIGGHAWNDYLNTHVAEDLVDTTLTELAGYIDFAQDFGKVITLETGIRYDHHSVVGGEWIPQFGAALHLPSQLEVKLSVGKGFRNPTVMDLFLFAPKNPDLKAERIWNYEIAVQKSLLGGRMHYGLNIYYLNGDNLITINRVDGRPIRMNTNKVENFGIELNADYRIDSHWTTNANYSYIRQSHDLLAVPRHKLYAETTYILGKVRTSLGMEYVGHLLTQIATQSQSEEKEDYLLLNARLSYQMSKILRLLVRGENLLAQRYEINAGYPMPRTTFMGGIQLHF